MNEIYDTLNLPLPSSSDETEQLREYISKAEALGHVTVKKIESISKDIAEIDKRITGITTKVVIENKDSKVAVIEALTNEATKEERQNKAEKDAELRYYKHVQGLIETRCSVGQSFLSNTTSQIKAGIAMVTPR